MCLQQNSIQNWTQSVQYATRQFDWQLDWNSTDYLVLTTRLTIQSWQLDWRSDNSTGNSALQFSLQFGLTIRLTIRLYNSAYNSAYKFAYNSALQFGLTVPLYNSAYKFAYNSALQFHSTIPAYNSYFQFRLTNSYLQIRLTIGLTILVDQNWWNDPSVRAATLPWSKAGVSCRGLRWRTLAKSDARMGRVTCGTDSFWWHFSVSRFAIMNLSPGPPRPHWTETAGAGGFIFTRADLLMCSLLARTRVSTRNAFL